MSHRSFRQTNGQVEPRPPPGQARPPRPTSVWSGKSEHRTGFRSRAHALRGRGIAPTTRSVPLAFPRGAWERGGKGKHAGSQTPREHTGVFSCHGVPPRVGSSSVLAPTLCVGVVLPPRRGASPWRSHAERGNEEEGGSTRGRRPRASTPAYFRATGCPRAWVAPLSVVLYGILLYNAPVWDIIQHSAGWPTPTFLSATYIVYTLCFPKSIPGGCTNDPETLKTPRPGS